MRNYVIISNGKVVDVQSKDCDWDKVDYSGKYDTVAEDDSKTFKIGDVYTIEKLIQYNQHLNPLSYSDLRRQEYPPMTEYLDAVVKGDDVAIQDYRDKCLAVKAKHPKV